MACPTCDHTMSHVGIVSVGNPASVYHCSRCGTLKMGHFEYVPWLVHRIIHFAGYLTDEHADVIEQFENSGVREAICKGGK